MKYRVLAISAILSLSVAGAQETSTNVAVAPTSVTLTDVPAGHWAKDFIDRLISKGIILGYPDGTFRGTQNLTRYEAAAMIARLLDSISNDPALRQSLNGDDLKSLQNAIQELAADLAALGVRVSDLEEDSISKADFSRLETRIEELGKLEGAGDAAALNAIKGRLEELASRVKEGQGGILRTEVEDNAGNITALNDLTVLLNQDILDLQDRVSAVEAARDDYVQRADFTNLTGRVKAVEVQIGAVDGKLAKLSGDLTKANQALDARVTKLEKFSFSVEPTLSVGYTVSRANRNFDVERLFPLNADGTVSKNAFGGAQKNSKDARHGRDYGDFGGDSSIILNGKDGLYGFATKKGPKYDEGETSISFGLKFNKSDTLNQVTSKKNGSLFTTKGGLSVNKVKIDFGLTSVSPDTTKYPEVVKNGYTYRPIFLKFKNSTASFTVGGNPLKITLGKKQKFYFSDYAFDNAYAGRGDGYIVEFQGDKLPVIGGLKPRILGVYGSRSGADAKDKSGYGVYYRGLRAEITPIDKLALGIFYAQEGKDDWGKKLNTKDPNKDVTLYGADLHGEAFGVNLHGAYTLAQVTPNKEADKYNTSALFIRLAKRDKDPHKGYDLSEAGFKVNAGIFGLNVHDLNYRLIDSKYNAENGLSYKGYDSTSKQNLSFVSKKVAGPFANLRLLKSTRDADGKAIKGDYVGQSGFGAKVSTKVGPVYVGGYYDHSAGAKNEANTAMDEMGVSAKGNLLGIFSVRGAYNILDSKRLQDYNKKSAAVKVNRLSVQADTNPGWGFYLGGYYRDVKVNDKTSSTDYGLLARGYLISDFGPVSNVYKSGSNCADRGFGDAVAKDIDGVGNALNPKVKPETVRSSTCYSAYGVELGHLGNEKKGDKVVSLVPDLNFRVGYARIFDDATQKHSANLMYADARYDRDLGFADVRVSGSYSNADIKLGSRAVGTRIAAGVIAKSKVIENLPFKPQINGQFGYYDSTFGSKKDKANAMKYGAGIVLNDVLLPEARLGVRYDGYNASNRSYTVFNGKTAGKFVDAANGRKTNLSGVYVEGAYQDLVFSYGTYTLSQKDAAGKEYGSGLDDGKAAQGQTFKISYKIKF